MSIPIGPTLVLIVLAGCVGAPNVRVAPPPAPSVDLSPFRRVWIAGFVSSANRDIDVNAETVRLLRRRLNPRTPLRVVEAQPLIVDDDAMLRDAERWRKLAEEYGEPLIVTGTVKLTSARPVAVELPSGRASSYSPRKGFVLEATFIYIDGRTGEVVASQKLPKETLYGASARTPTLSLYFQLMDRVVPAFLRVFR